MMARRKATGDSGIEPCESLNAAYPMSSTQRYPQTSRSRPNQAQLDKGARDAPYAAASSAREWGRWRLWEGMRRQARLWLDLWR